MPPLPNDEELTIKAGGATIGGWTNIQVRRNVEQLPSGFTIEATELYPGMVAETPIKVGSPVEVRLGGDLVLTGYLDVYAPREEAQMHIVRLMGRSKTEDLVDCSLLGPPWEFYKATIGEAAKIICDPFGITVTGDGVNEPLDPAYPFLLDPGMTAGQMLDRMARVAQVLLFDDPQGRLVLSKIGTTRAATALVEGQNCEVAEARISMDQRYSIIKVAAQTWINDSAVLHKALEATAKDSQVPRYRPKLIIMDTPGPDTKYLQQRADWEVKRRYGRGNIAEIKVVGWRDGAGTLWTPNTIVNVSCPTIKMERDMVIAGCVWLRGDQGTETILTCMPTEALSPQPYVPQNNAMIWASATSPQSGSAVNPAQSGPGNTAAQGGGADTPVH